MERVEYFIKLILPFLIFVMIDSIVNDNTTQAWITGIASCLFIHKYYHLRKERNVRVIFKEFLSPLNNYSYEDHNKYRQTVQAMHDAYVDWRMGKFPLKTK